MHRAPTRLALLSALSALCAFGCAPLWQGAYDVRTRSYDVRRYVTEMTVSSGLGRLMCKTWMIVAATEDDVSAITLDARGLRFIAVGVNNRQAMYTTTDSTVKITLPRTLRRNDSIVVRITHESDRAPGMIWNDSALVTGAATSRWLPCSMSPADSALFRLDVMLSSRFTMTGPGVPLDHQPCYSDQTQWTFDVSRPTHAGAFGFSLRRLPRQPKQ